MNNHDLSVAPASHGRPDRGCSASVIGSKAPELNPITSTTAFTGGSGGVRGPCWGHFSEIDEGYGRDARWVDQIPSWAIFSFGLCIGAALSWLVL